MYLFLPFYWLIFLLSNWADVQRHVLRVVLASPMMIGGLVVMAKHGINGDGDEDGRRRVSSGSRAGPRDGASDANNETTAPGNQTPAANNQTQQTNPASGRGPDSGRRGHHSRHQF